MAVIIHSSMVKILTTIQVNLVPNPSETMRKTHKFTLSVVIKFFAKYHSHFLATTFDFTSFSHWHFGAAHFFTACSFCIDSININCLSFVNFDVLAVFNIKLYSDALVFLLLCSILYSPMSRDDFTTP